MPEDWDLLLYVKSVDFIRWVTPPDAQDEAIRAMRDNGYASFASAGWGVKVISGGMSPYSGRFGNKPIRDKELPNDEAEAVRLVWSLATEKNRRLHVVDVGKESSFRRVIEEHLHHLTQFPILVRKDRQRLEGLAAFTHANLERFLSE